jgi:hypothetical protein
MLSPGPSAAGPMRNPITGRTTAQAVETWKAFAPPGSGFSVTMPGQPSREADGESLVTYRLETKTGMRYLITHSNKKDIPPEAEQSIVNAAVASFEQEFDSKRAKLVVNRAVKRDGHPGHEMQVTFPEGGKGFLQVYAANGHVYILLAIADPGADPAHAPQFLNSFKFVP